MIVRNGGKKVIQEKKEIYGEEKIMKRREVKNEVEEKMMKRIDWWRDYKERKGEEIKNNK